MVVSHHFFIFAVELQWKEIKITLFNLIICSVVRNIGV